MRLAHHYGVNELRIEDIAREAGISTRTFGNYFDNKYQALMARHIDSIHHAAEALRRRPPDEPLWQAISNAILGHWSGDQSSERSLTPAALAELRLLFGGRRERGKILKAAVADDSELQRAIAERIGADPNRDIYPRLVAAAVTSVVQVSMDAFLKADPPMLMLSILSDALAQLRLGFPVPTPAVAPTSAGTVPAPKSRGTRSA